MSTWYNAKCYDMIYIYCVCTATIKPRVMLTSTITFILLSCRRITNCRTSSWPLLRQAYVNFSHPQTKILPNKKKNAQKMNRSKRFRVPMGLLRLFTIYIIIYIYILYRGFRPGIHQNLSRPRCHRLDSPWWDPLSNSHGSHAASDPPLETGRCRPPQAPGDRTQLLCSENSIQTNRCSKAAG